jgi:hypothetical protein
MRPCVSVMGASPTEFKFAIQTDRGDRITFAGSLLPD